MMINRSTFEAASVINKIHPKAKLELLDDDDEVSLGSLYMTGVS